MAAQKTATIETLTAEVRVLMVGSRQITMSVYGQLDVVNAEEIQPFGRVGPSRAEWWELWVIGRNVATGDLVRSRVPNVRRLEEMERLALLGAFMNGAADPRRELICKISAEWSGLPLIVLAGLR